MNKSILYPISLLIAATFVSCYETDSDIIVPKQPRKLVISSFISPEDTDIHIIVSRSFPLNDTSTQNDLFISDATVIISSATASDTLPFDEFKNGYSVSTSEFPIEPGETYSIDVSTPNGMKVSAQCTTPLNQPLDFTYHIDSVVSNRSKQYIIEMKWNDIPGKKLYYRTVPELLYCYFSDSIFTCASSYFSSSRRSVFEGNGGTEEFSVTYTSDPIPVESTSLIRLQLISVDKDYFQFYNTLSTDIGIPVTEPVYTYTNIKDGLGIFASYNNRVQKEITY